MSVSGKDEPDDTFYTIIAFLIVGESGFRLISFLLFDILAISLAAP